MKLLGYEVETQIRNDRQPYLLKGPRGAMYGLVRQVDNPHLLFAINMRPKYVGICVQVKGYSWFTDKDGQLEPVNLV